MTKLIEITTITATLELITGTRIGAGDSEMHIGGVDNTVIKHPHTQVPYLPGSSLKGKIRSLLEWRSGAVQEQALAFEDYEKTSGKTQEEVKKILQLFGISGDAKQDLKNLELIGPTRVSFWDCSLNHAWVQNLRENNLPLTEVKSENRINRISGVAEHPRQTERVPAGSEFDFRLSVKKLEGDSEQLLNTLLSGLKLLELDSLGGAGSRGYGKVKFKNLSINGKPCQTEFDALQAFAI